MKIAILTLPLNFNYGGILQAYALQTLLERKGHEVYVIDPPQRRKRLTLIKSFFKYWVKRNILRQGIEYITESERLRLKKVQELYTRPFIEEHIKLLTVSSLNEKYLKDFDAIIVGSDQIWRKRYFTFFFDARIDDAYLSFIKKKSIKKIAYAASFGTGIVDYSSREILRCKKLLSKFDAISVREDTAIKLISEVFDRSDVRLTLDPTLLLTINDYKSLADISNIETDGSKLMCYILDYSNKKDAIVKKIEETRQIKAFVTNIGDFDEKPQPRLENWLRSFIESSFIITDSFHACVFSIIFRKPFVVLGNKQRGEDRIRSLLSIFNMENHIINSLSDYHENDSYEIADSVYDILKKKRIDSMNFLMNNLL